MKILILIEEYYCYYSMQIKFIKDRKRKEESMPLKNQDESITKSQG